VLIEVKQHTEYTEIKLTNIQGFRRICFLILLSSGLKMKVYLASAGPMGCQLPHFITRHFFPSYQQLWGHQSLQVTGMHLFILVCVSHTVS